MRSLYFVLTSLMVIGLAFWAYRENYETQEAQARLIEVQSKISEERDRLRILNAEWAYLNRPENLRNLVEMNFDRLGLLPLQASQFGKIDQVAFPAEEDELDVWDTIEVMEREVAE